MRMDMVADTSVPIMTCRMVCFFNITLDAAMRGVKRKTNGTRVE